MTRSTAEEPLVVHVSPRVQGRGGIETLHGYHAQLPGRQVFVALFDRQPTPRADYINLNFTWHTPIWLMRRRFRAALAPYAGAVVVYHNGRGLPLFHDVDGAARRVLFLHGNPVFHSPDIPSFRGLVDGVLGVTPALAELWTTALPELPPDRTKVLRAPVEPPADLFVNRLPGRTIVLGYAGRLEYRHKRLERLPALIRELQAHGVDFRFELLGDGSQRADLSRQLGSAAHFHGWVPRDQFWRVMANWDAMVFFSDVEGGPIAMFEGMSLGLVCFYPTSGGSWGDVYAPRIDTRCHYPVGDMPVLARAIKEIFAQPAQELLVMRERARSLIQPHQLASYLADSGGFLREIADKPAIAQVHPHQAKLTDALPLGLATHVVPRARRI